MQGFDLTKINPILDYLKKISPNMYRVKGQEIIIHCPYCDDAYRPNAHKHGHLYISTNYPVFNCFRCETSGTLIKLLVDNGFDDQEILTDLSKYIKYKFIRDYSLTRSLKTTSNLLEIKRRIIKKHIDFKNEYKQIYYSKFKEYIKERVGEINILDFLIIPDIIYNRLCCGFINSNNEYIYCRFINDNKYKHMLNKKSSGLYYFQDVCFENRNEIVLTEGTFDIINTAIYCSEFNFDKTFYMSVSGKKYTAAIENLLFNYLMIGEYRINLIFDQDVYNYKSFLYKAKRICNTYNNNIEIRGWKPLSGKDVGEFPVIVEVT